MPAADPVVVAAVIGAATVLVVVDDCFALPPEHALTQRTRATSPPGYDLAVIIISMTLNSHDRFRRAKIADGPSGRNLRGPTRSRQGNGTTITSRGPFCPPHPAQSTASCCDDGPTS